jgi:hypothetical protein
MNPSPQHPIVFPQEAFYLHIRLPSVLFPSHTCIPTKTHFSTFSCVLHALLILSSSVLPPYLYLIKHANYEDLHYAVASSLL